MVKKTISTKSKVAVGAGLAAIAVAGVAGAYFLYGKDGAKNRKKVKSWAIMAKGEALAKLEKLKDINEDAYHAVVETVSAKYAKLKSTTPEEIAQFTKEMKSHWKGIKAEFAPKVKAKAKKK
jgi:hypothetical protein